MTILVTGSAGFIGSHVAERLIGHGHVVFGVDNFDPFYDRAIKDSNHAELLDSTAYRFSEADIGDADAMAAVFAEAVRIDRPIDLVVHLAAKAGVRPSIEDPIGYTRTNVDGTTSVLQCARDAGVTDVVFASSSSVYGNTREVPFREDAWVDYPISPYAATKKACELLSHAYAHLHGMRIAALRFFTVYGPRQRPDLAIAKFARLLRAGEAIPVYGDGSSRRDYTYIDDTVAGVIGSIDWLRRQAAGTYAVFNLGESRTVTLAELISLLESALGVTARIDRKPMQPGDVEQTYADIGRARDAFGYDPRTPIEDGITRYVSWLAADSAR